MTRRSERHNGVHTRIVAVAALLVAVFALQVHPAFAQDRPLIVLDPGHGGADFGVQAESILEKELILRISFAIAAELVDAGYDVAFTRTTDRGVAWADRRGFAEERDAVLLFMLHINGNEDVSKHGAEIYTNPSSPEGVRAGGALGRTLEALGSEVLLDPRDWPFLASPSVPTVMVELGFLTHPVERRLLQSPEFHRELGKAFATAADDFSKGR